MAIGNMFESDGSVYVHIQQSSLYASFVSFRLIRFAVKRCYSEFHVDIFFLNIKHHFIQFMSKNRSLY